jgi:hypothetical protein
LAATNAFGAGGFTDAHADALRGVVGVVILEDHDSAGIKRTERVGRMLRERGVPVRLVRFEGEPEGFDVTDYRRQHTAEQLRHLIAGAPLWEPAAAEQAAKLTGPIAAVRDGIGLALAGLPIRVGCDGFPILPAGTSDADLLRAIERMEQHGARCAASVNMFTGRLVAAIRGYGSLVGWCDERFGVDSAQYMRFRMLRSVSAAWRDIWTPSATLSWTQLRLGARRVFSNEERAGFVSHPPKIAWLKEQVALRGGAGVNEGDDTRNEDPDHFLRRSLRDLRALQESGRVAQAAADAAVAAAAGLIGAVLELARDQPAGGGETAESCGSYDTSVRGERNRSIVDRIHNSRQSAGCHMEESIVDRIHNSRQSAGCHMTVVPDASDRGIDYDELFEDAEPDGPALAVADETRSSSTSSGPDDGPCDDADLFDEDDEPRGTDPFADEDPEPGAPCDPDPPDVSRCSTSIDPGSGVVLPVTAEQIAWAAQNARSRTASHAGRRGPGEDLGPEGNADSDFRGSLAERVLWDGLRAAGIPCSGWVPLAGAGVCRPDLTVAGVPIEVKSIGSGSGYAYVPEGQRRGFGDMRGLRYAILQRISESAMRVYVATSAEVGGWKLLSPDDARGVRSPCRSCPVGQLKPLGSLADLAGPASGTAGADQAGGVDGQSRREAGTGQGNGYGAPRRERTPAGGLAGMVGRPVAGGIHA